MASAAAAAATGVEEPPRVTPRRLSHVRMIAELHASRPARSLEHVLPPTWRGVLREWLAADAPTFDVGGFVVGDSHEEAVLLVKGAPGGSGGVVLAGVPFVTALFQEELGCSVEWLMAEGDVLTPPCAAAVVRGPARKLLLGERTALNILSRACGVATAARALADAARSAGWRGAVAGTRKVTPGFRLVEKYALLVGGAATHRMDLSHMVMLKDNHVWSAGSIAGAVAAARSVCGFSSKIEVEVGSLEEALEAAGAGAEVVMLDNYATPEALCSDAAALKRVHPGVLVEASGGISAATLPRFLHPAVDVVSVGALTNGYAVADISLKIARGGGAAALARVLPGHALPLSGAAPGVSGGSSGRPSL